jgi:heme A synthase
MSKRLAISALWFVAIQAVGGIAHLALDVPRALMTLVALAVAVAWWVGLARYDAWLAERNARAAQRVYAGIRAVNAALDH